jgi:hypothetical protein
MKIFWGERLRVFLPSRRRNFFFTPAHAPTLGDLHNQHKKENPEKHQTKLSGFSSVSK